MKICCCFGFGVLRGNCISWFLGFELILKYRTLNQENNLLSKPLAHFDGLIPPFFADSALQISAPRLISRPAWTCLCTARRSGSWRQSLKTSRNWFWARSRFWQSKPSVHLQKKSASTHILKVLIAWSPANPSRSWTRSPRPRRS